MFPVPNERVGFEAGAAAGDKGAEEAEEQSERGDLVRFDLRRLKETVLCAACVQHVTLSRDGQSMAVLESSPEGDWVRVVPAGEKPKDEDENEEEVDPYTPGRDSGIVDISGRVRVLVEPVREWRQMLRQVCGRVCVRVHFGSYRVLSVGPRSPAHASGFQRGADSNNAGLDQGPLRLSFQRR